LATILSSVYKFVVEEKWWNDNVPKVKAWLERCFEKECVKASVGSIRAACQKKIAIPSTEEN